MGRLGPKIASVGARTRLPPDDHLVNRAQMETSYFSERHASLAITWYNLPSRASYGALGQIWSEASRNQTKRPYTQQASVAKFVGGLLVTAPANSEASAAEGSSHSPELKYFPAVTSVDWRICGAHQAPVCHRANQPKLWPVSYFEKSEWGES